MPSDPRSRQCPLRWPLRLFLVGAAVCAVLLLVSLRKAVVIGLSGYGVLLTDGGVWVMHRGDFEYREWATTDTEGRLEWWPPYAFTRTYWRASPAWAFDVRLWFLGAVCLAGAGVCVLGPRIAAARRRRAGRCATCGFDLSATPAPAPCPECGCTR